MTAIAHNLEAIRQAIKTAAQKAGRDPAGIKLAVVSKGQPEEKIRAALLAGHRMFGENRVQEARAKFAPLRGDYPDLELHLIGPLQTNKCEEAIQLFNVIETLDRPKLAEALAVAIRKSGYAPKFFIEVNIGEEPQKAGTAPGELRRFLNYCQKDCGLLVEGLMCIPPQMDDPKPHFLRLKELAAHHGLGKLSMGMSADFEIAIACGSTEVRVGTAIFGARVSSGN
jgi:pyridoxal phosphate enzyme (YggS family)